MAVGPAYPWEPTLRCRLCSSKLLVPRLKLHSTPPANAFMATKAEAIALEAYPLEVVQCLSCSHHQLAHVVRPDILFSNYAYVSGTSESFRLHFDGLATALKQAGARRVVELGSNDGTLLKALDKNGVRAVGVEFAENLVSMSRGEGLEVLCGGGSVENFQDASDILAPGADYWVACNVLAHIDGFGDVLRALHHTGATKGVFEVQYLQDGLKHGLFDNIYHEHLDYWRATELIDHLHHYTGWWVTKVEHINTHGGSLRVWVSDGQSFSGTGMAGIYLEEEVKDTAKAFKKLEEKIAQCRKALHGAVAPYMRVAAYGAPAKLTTFLSEMSYHPSYVVDDSPHKQGKFTPGSGIPVYPSSHLIEDPPDAIVVTAWNFAEGIVKKLRGGLVPAGVPIIVPFPEVKVL